MHVLLFLVRGARKAALMCTLLGLSLGPVRGQWNLVVPDPEIPGYTNFLGQGLSFVDFNLDGWDDLTVTNASGALHFYAGGADGLTEVDLGIALAAGRPIAPMWLDIDNDGDRDFICTAGMAISVFSGAGEASRSALWINEGGEFVDRTSAWGLDVLENRNCAGMAWHDVDQDGDLDGMVSVYALPCEGHWMTENVMFRQDADGLVDVSLSSGIANGIQSTFQGVWMNLDGDGLMDLFVIHDAGVEFDCSAANHAYINNGDWTFTESGSALGLNEFMSSMSATVGDPDGDGEEEIFVTNQAADASYAFSLQTAGYFDADENGLWLERADEVGLDADRWSWSAAWVDMDLDGAEELCVATNVFSVPGDGQQVELYDNHLYRRAVDASGPDMAFAEDTTNWPGRDRPMHCIVRGDLDGDGDPDGVGLGIGPFATVWTNEVESTHPQHRWLTVSVCGTHSNAEAIGTRMVLHVNGLTQQRTLRAGDDLFAQHSATQFFGMGLAQVADSLELFWPDGSRSVRYGLEANSNHRVVQFEEQVAVEFGEVLGDSIQLTLQAPPKWTGVVWNGEPSSSLTRTVALGEAVLAQVEWFQGLFAVDFAVDWSAIDALPFGCTDPAADNYDAQAESENGSCMYASYCGEGAVWSSCQGQCIASAPACSPDIDSDGMVNVADILHVLSQFGLPCIAVEE